MRVDTQQAVSVAVAGEHVPSKKCQHTARQVFNKPHPLNWYVQIQLSAWCGGISLLMLSELGIIYVSNLGRGSNVLPSKLVVHVKVVPTHPSLCFLANLQSEFQIKTSGEFDQPLYVRRRLLWPVACTFIDLLVRCSAVNALDCAQKWGLIVTEWLWAQNILFCWQ